jgi:hypothetical protein
MKVVTFISTKVKCFQKFVIQLSLTRILKTKSILFWPKTKLRVNTLQEVLSKNLFLRNFNSGHILILTRKMISRKIKCHTKIKRLLNL